MLWVPNPSYLFMAWHSPLFVYMAVLTQSHSLTPRNYIEDNGIRKRQPLGPCLYRRQLQTLIIFGCAPLLSRWFMAVQQVGYRVKPHHISMPPFCAEWITVHWICFPTSLEVRQVSSTTNYFSFCCSALLLLVLMTTVNYSGLDRF